MISRSFLLALLCCAYAVDLVGAVRPTQFDATLMSKKPKNRFVSPKGLFIQERASKQLPGPGQHFSFGALKSWEEIHAALDSDPDTKLLLLVRHGQAMSNWLGDTLGPDEWFTVEETCAYTNENGTTYGVFDADLTELGQNEAKSLNSMLNDAGWFTKLTAGKPVSGIVSPLSRCLQTAALVTKGLPLTKMEVEENVRETLGEDTCDARRSMSDPDPNHPEELEGPCPFERGLATAFPNYKFRVVDEAAREMARRGEAPAGNTFGGFGLLSDRDTLWTKDRETQKEQIKRANTFLYDVFEYVEERVVVVVTHSGFTRSVLLAVGREPYRPQNTELVPIIVKMVTKAPLGHLEDV